MRALSVIGWIWFAICLIISIAFYSEAVHIPYGGKGVADAVYDYGKALWMLLFSLPGVIIAMLASIAAKINKKSA